MLRFTRLYCGLAMHSPIKQIKEPLIGAIETRVIQLRLKRSDRLSKLKRGFTDMHRDRFWAFNFNATVAKIEDCLDFFDSVWSSACEECGLPETVLRGELLHRAYAIAKAACDARSFNNGLPPWEWKSAREKATLESLNKWEIWARNNEKDSLGRDVFSLRRDPLGLDLFPPQANKLPFQAALKPLLPSGGAYQYEGTTTIIPAGQI